MVDFIDRQRSQDVPRDEPFIFHRFVRDDKESNKGIHYKENYINPVRGLLQNENFTKEIKEDVLLRNLNPRLLEDPDTDRRVDDFIADLLGRIRANAYPQRQAVLPNLDTQRVRIPPNHSFSSPTGLRAITWDQEQRTEIPDFKVGEQVVVRGTDEFTEIHFTPEGRISFNPKKITDSLTNGIRGLTDFFEAIDNGDVVVADYLVGVTNINMALIAQRLGFKITDDCRTQDGNINKDLNLFRIVGKLTDIRAKVEEFQRSGVSEKLMRRNQRLRTNPQPI